MNTNEMMWGPEMHSEQYSLNGNKSTKRRVCRASAFPGTYRPNITARSMRAWKLQQEGVLQEAAPATCTRPQPPLRRRHTKPGPARRRAGTVGFRLTESSSPPERSPYRLFQADTRSSASCCSRLSPQYSPTITWSHSALPLHATTVRSGFSRLRLGEKDRRPQRHAAPPLPAMARLPPVLRAELPLLRAALPGEARRGCGCVLLGLTDLRGLGSARDCARQAFRWPFFLSFWRKVVSARVVISAADFHPGSEEKQALARG